MLHAWSTQVVFFKPPNPNDWMRVYGRIDSRGQVRRPRVPALLPPPALHRALPVGRMAASCEGSGHAG